ncbi:hypothetical protein [Trinickia sp.]|uniref:hypothetical protein n=1 Tax=Trinickia sp. TaxID=2571163 RepID=UPI003F81F340
MSTKPLAFTGGNSGMASIIDHPAFKSRPTLGQFAKNGQWETAWAFGRDEVPSFEHVRDYLDGATEVAFEAFFDSAFFGIRFCGTTQEITQRAFECVIALRNALDGASFFADLSTRLELDALGHDVSFAEVGAVNAWRSVGPFRIDRPYDLSDCFDTLWHALGASAVGSDVLHRKAIEFAYDRPVAHWFALPVSAPVAPFRLDSDSLQEAARSVLGTS